MKELNQKYSTKISNKIRKFLIKNYYSENCPTKFKVLETSDEFNFMEMEKDIYSKSNKVLFKEYFKFFDHKDINIVIIKKVFEKEEDFKMRIEKEENIILSNWKQKMEEEEIKNKKKKINKKVSIESPVININREPRFTEEIVSSNIDMSNSYCDFSKWVGSVFQNIKDLRINDVYNEKENLWKKIYPQKNGIPVYNPKGLYWVKLYHMGKPRKIIIDDTIPCNKDGENLFPKCSFIDEYWPLIITKAIVKLFSYKFKSKIFSRKVIGDIQLFYALTGYIPEIKISICLKKPLLT